MSEKLVTAMEVFARMVETDDQAFRVAPMSEIRSARKVKRGTLVTIGVGDDICLQIAEGSLVGGFLFVDRKHFEEVKAQLAKERLP